MVLVGFFCVLGAIGLLIVGLVQSDPDLVWASIGASAAGGLAVVAASIQRSRSLRRAAAANKHTGVAPSPSRRAAVPAAIRQPEFTPPKAAAAQPKPEPTEPDKEDVEVTAQARPTIEAVTETPTPPPAVVGTDVVEATDEVVAPTNAEPDSDDPADEPPEEDVDMADLLVIIDLTDEVLVVDLRPRYHLSGCTHLQGREAIPLPVNEAREDGFTPCALCQPDAALAGAVRQARSPDNSGPARARPRPGPG